jgi:error-prone DNA polymerase
VAPPAYAELHCHGHFSFLDGASSPDDLVARAVELNLTGLAITDHQGLYGAVRFSAAAEAAGLHPVIGIEIELLDAAVPDPDGIVVPARRAWRPGRRGARAAPEPPRVIDGRPARPRPDRTRLPGHRAVVKEDHRGIGESERGPHLVLLARDATGWRSLCRLVSRANLAGTKAVPVFTHALLAEHTDGLLALSGCRHGELARRLRAGDREGAAAAAAWHARLFGTADAAAESGFVLELSHHLLPDDDWLAAETARLADVLGLPTVVTNDVHYALPEGRELHDVLTAIRHGLPVADLRDLRRPDGESYLKSAAELLALPPGDPAVAAADPVLARAWREGIAASVEIAAACRVELGFERYRFPGFDVPRGETPFSHLSELCWEGARRRYHPLTPGVVKQLAHELDVIERTGLAEFFLICWDLMRFARSRGIPAQGRGSAADSIVAYVLGITRVDPIRHELLFERFINEGRTAYPDVDIDFSSERREEVIQYVYERYGPEHTGMVCNLVTYRARSAVREVGNALGFPRPLVDRVAKALETYDSVMVRRDLEAEGGFAQFFTRPEVDAAAGDAIRGARRLVAEMAVAGAAALATERGLIDGMGQLNHERGGRIPHAPPTAGIGGARPAPRPGGHGDDEGGPGDSPVSERWIREGLDREVARRPESSGRWLAGASPRILEGPVRPPDRRAETGSSVARLDPPPERDPGRHQGSVAGLSDWERWLELCARIDGFPRHLSIHSGGMLVTAAPLVDIVPIERATMKDRVVVQYDKRDVETMKLIKLDLLGLGMLAAIDETVQLVEHDGAVCLDLDRIPEQIPEVFEMLQAADTVGVFQVESRAQMQTLPKSRPASLDDLVVEVAIIRPGPIQGNAVHPYLRRKQGLEPVTYLHPSLEPILHDTLGVILYQEQVMKIAIDVAGFTPAGSDAFRRAMGTYRSQREMEKLHAEFVDGCERVQGMPREDAEELFRRVAGFASFGFAKSHAAAFARTAYESSFLKLFYPAQFVTGLINAQPMGFYPVEVLVNDAKRHGVAVLPVDVNRSTYRTTTEWVGRPGWALAGVAGDDGSHDGDAGEPLPDGSGIEARPSPVRSPACVVPGAAARERWAAESVTGWGVRLGLHLVKGIGEEQQARLDAELGHGPYTSLADVVERTGLAEEVVERLIRAGALDSLGRPRRELLWQLREVAGSAKGRMDGRARGRKGITRAAGRPMDLRLPATEAPPLPPITEPERLGDAYAVVGLDARRQAVSLFRDALDRLGAVTNAALAERRPGPVRIGGLVVTRQHPMTARGTVFLALEDETGMVNVTLWPDTWQRLRSAVRRHALLLVDGDLQREGDVVNVIAREVTPLVDAAAAVGGPSSPLGVKAIGQAGLRRLG